MEGTGYISLGISVMGMLGGLISWGWNLKIKHDILENNEKLEKIIGDNRDKLSRDIASVNDNLIRELALFKEKTTQRLEDLDKDNTEQKANLNDRILTVVNGKYVRTDLHGQTIAGIQERFVTFKQFIELGMEKIEQNLDRQIIDLKDRIFHDK